MSGWCAGFPVTPPSLCGGCAEGWTCLLYTSIQEKVGENENIGDVLREELEQEWDIWKQTAKGDTGSDSEEEPSGTDETEPSDQALALIHISEEIEARSMASIEAEMPEGNWTPGELAVVKRCIHTAADFDYASNLYFSDGAVELAVNLMKSGDVYKRQA